MNKRLMQYRQNYKFTDSLKINDNTYHDYLARLKKIAMSRFEWVNLPKSMNERWLEETLFYNGKATFLNDEKYGFINTQCCDNGYVNIYGLPTQFVCFSFNYYSTRKLYTGLNPMLSDKQFERQKLYECILVMNDWDMNPTIATIELFAYRLYMAEQTAFINIMGQRTPIMILVGEKQRLMMENLYNQYNGNQPFIFGDKKQLNDVEIKAIKTDSPFIADKIMEYKKQIWNEALEFLGINTIALEKKERMITDEANNNNELINLNLQSYLAPRQKACEDFNIKYGLKGTDKEISVRVRSDLHNTIKEQMSSVTDIKNENITKIENLKEGEENG